MQKEMMDDKENHTDSNASMDKLREDDVKASGPVYSGSTLPDVFFVVLYVGGLFNISNILFDSPTNLGLLYFVGTLSAITPMWLEKSCYKCRFVYGEEMWHRALEAGMLISLATAVIHIQTADVLSTPSKHVDMFAFCLALVISSLLTIYRYVAICILYGDETTDDQAIAKRYVLGRCFSAVFYLIATVLSGIKFYGSSHDSASSESNLPIFLCLVGSLLWWCHLFISVIISSNEESPVSNTLLLNVESHIHSVGEWTMLVLGASVFGVLFTGVIDEVDYNSTFCFVVLLLILLQILHFRSQPRHEDQHALRRDSGVGISWAILHEVYTASLLAVGTSCRFFISSFNFEELDGGERGLALSSEFSKEDLEQRSADVFCFALATVMICLDAMILIHNGYQNVMNRCMVQNKDGIIRWRERSFVLILMRVALIVFMATFSQYETTPVNVSSVGAVCVGILHCFRSLFDFYFPLETLNREPIDDASSREVSEVIEKEPEIIRSKETPVEDHSIDKDYILSFDTESSKSASVIEEENSLTISTWSTLSEDQQHCRVGSQSTMLEVAENSCPALLFQNETDLDDVLSFNEEGKRTGAGKRIWYYETRSGSQLNQKSSEMEKRNPDDGQRSMGSLSTENSLKAPSVVSLPNRPLTSSLKRPGERSFGSSRKSVRFALSPSQDEVEVQAMDSMDEHQGCDIISFPCKS